MHSTQLQEVNITTGGIMNGDTRYSKNIGMNNMVKLNLYGKLLKIKRSQKGLGRTICHSDENIYQTDNGIHISKALQQSILAPKVTIKTTKKLNNKTQLQFIETSNKTTKKNC